MRVTSDVKYSVTKKETKCDSLSVPSSMSHLLKCNSSPLQWAQKPTEVVTRLPEHRGGREPCEALRRVKAVFFVCFFLDKACFTLDITMIPTSVMTSAMSCLSWAVRSGAIFTRTGGLCCSCRASRSFCTWADSTSVRWWGRETGD